MDRVDADVCVFKGAEYWQMCAYLKGQSVGRCAYLKGQRACRFVRI